MSSEQASICARCSLMMGESVAALGGSLNLLYKHGYGVSLLTQLTFFVSLFS